MSQSSGETPGFGSTLSRLSTAQKPPAKGSPAYSRFVNRRIGRILAAFASVLGMTPNQVTAVSAIFSAAGIVVIATVDPTVWSAFLVMVCLVLGYAFDSADGQLARLRGGGSAGGEWLDHVVDSVKVSALPLAVLVCWYRFYDVDSVWLLVPLGSALVSAAFFFVQILTDQLRRAHPFAAPKSADASARAVLRSVALLPTDYGVLCLSFVLLAWQPVFVAVYGILFVCTTLFMMLALPKWFHEVSRYGQPQAPRVVMQAEPQGQ